MSKLKYIGNDSLSYCSERPDDLYVDTLICGLQLTPAKYHRDKSQDDT